MPSKPKVEIAREHLSEAQEEAGAGDLRERKGMFYEGEDPDLGELSTEDVLNEVETAVEIAEDEAK